MSLPLFNEKTILRARATSTSFGIADTGTHQVAVGFVIVDNPDYGGSAITWVGHFTDKTSARTIESLQHLGWKGEDLAELEDLGGDECARLLPDVVELVVEPEQDREGEWRNKVRWVNRAGGSRFAFKTQLKGAELKSFAAQMRATVKSVRGNSGRPVANGSRPSGGQSRHPNAPDEDDKIPF